MYFMDYGKTRCRACDFWCETCGLRRKSLFFAKGDDYRIFEVDTRKGARARELDAAAVDK